MSGFLSNEHFDKERVDTWTNHLLVHPDKDDSDDLVFDTGDVERLPSIEEVIKAKSKEDGLKSLEPSSGHTWSAFMKATLGDLLTAGSGGYITSGKPLVVNFGEKSHVGLLCKGIYPFVKAEKRVAVAWLPILLEVLEGLVTLPSALFGTCKLLKKFGDAMAGEKGFLMPEASCLGGEVLTLKEEACKSFSTVKSGHIKARLTLLEVIDLEEGLEQPPKEPEAEPEDFTSFAGSQAGSASGAEIQEAKDFSYAGCN